MKKYLSYLPHSISALVLAIIGHINFWIAAFILYVNSEAVTATLQGKTYFLLENKLNYVTPFSQSYIFGIFLYLLEYYIFSKIFQKEFSKIDLPEQNPNIFRNIFIYLGFSLFFLMFTIIIILSSLSIINITKAYIT